MILTTEVVWGGQAEERERMKALEPELLREERRCWGSLCIWREKGEAMRCEMRLSVEVPGRQQLCSMLRHRASLLEEMGFFKPFKAVE